MRVAWLGVGPGGRRLGLWVGLLALVLPASPALALGPPEFTFASIMAEGTTLVLRVRVAVPGGRVPRDIAAVEVRRPSGQVVPVPLERTDLGPEGSFAVSLGSVSQFGTVSGAYRVFALDTAGGIAELDLGYQLPQVVAAATGLKVTGSALLPSGLRTLDLGVTPGPAVVFDAVDGAPIHHVVVRELSADVEAVRVVVPGVGGEDDTREVDLPGGVLVPGRRYVVSVEAFDAPGALACTTTTGCIYADARARSTVGLDLVTLGPDVTLTVSGGLAVGQTVVLGARVVHPGSPVTVNVLGFVGLPGGGVLTGTVTGLTLETALDPVVFDNLLTHTFTPADSAGSYVLGVRLTDPATGATLAQATRTIER